MIARVYIWYEERNEEESTFSVMLASISSSFGARLSKSTFTGTTTKP